MTLENFILNIFDNIPFLNGNKYIEALTIVVGFFILSKLVVFIFQKVFLKLTIKTKTDLDDKIINKTNRPISFILLFFGLRLAIELIGLAEQIEKVVSNVLYSINLIIFGYIIIISFDIIIDSWGRSFAKRTKSDIDDQLLAIFHRFSRILLSFIAFLFILKIWGFEIGPLLASLGIIGIAVAFALQNTLGNIFGGVSIILDKSVKVGDIIKLDEEAYGEVMDVGLRSTKIKTWNNELVTIPNGKLADSKINNFALPDPSARVIVEFSVEYGNDVGRVKEIVLKEIKKNTDILKEPEPFVRFDRMGDFSLNFRAFFWVENHKIRFDQKEKVTIAIYNVLNKNKIGIPFPTRTIFMKKN